MKKNDQSSNSCVFGVLEWKEEETGAEKKRLKK